MDFVYDVFGNSTTYRGNTLAFHGAEGLLTHFDNGQLTAGYDALGRRKRKASGAAQTYYVYDGETPVLECDAFGAVVAVNVFGANGLISRTTYDEGSEASVLIYLFDPLGNVVHRVDPTGAVRSNDLYDAWGTLLASEDPNGNPYPGGDPYGYKGQYGYYTDEETGLILCTYRYYDPEMGRWLTRDAAGYGGGINLYVYCENEPVGSVDSSGNQSKGMDIKVKYPMPAEKSPWRSEIARELRYILNHCCPIKFQPPVS